MTLPKTQAEMNEWNRLRHERRERKQAEEEEIEQQGKEAIRSDPTKSAERYDEIQRLKKIIESILEIAND